MKSILCLLGVHRWRRMRSEDGGWYEKCDRCGKFRDLPAGGVYKEWDVDR